MSYEMYLAGVELPVPARLTVKTPSQNKTLVLLDQGEISFLRSPGLKEIELPLVLPMLTGGRSPDFYLALLEELKTGRQSARFILVRYAPGGRLLFDTNLTVGVEEYSVTEDAGEGLDVQVDVTLKQWRSCQLKTLDDEGNTTQGREEETAPSASTYTVKKGDCLWAIAAKYYGKGSEYRKIYEANLDQISNPNLIYPGQVLILP